MPTQLYPVPGLDEDDGEHSDGEDDEETWGTGVSGGTEAIAIFHLLIEDLWHKDITKPIAIVQVDQKSCFDSLNICALTQPSHKIARVWHP